MTAHAAILVTAVRKYLRHTAEGRAEPGRATPKSSLYEAVALLPPQLKPDTPNVADKTYRALHALAGLCSLHFEAVPGFQQDIHAMLRDLAEALELAAPADDHKPARWVGN